MGGVHRNFIAGRWVDAAELRSNINPSDLSDVIGEYGQATEADVDNAAEAAAPAWRNASSFQRFEILDRIGTELMARKDEIGRLLSREEGKTLAEGVTEIARAGAPFKYFAGEALRAHAERMPSTRPGVTRQQVRALPRYRLARRQAHNRFQSARAGGHGDCQRFDCRSRLSRALHWSQVVVVRPARALALRDFYTAVKVAYVSG